MKSSDLSFEEDDSFGRSNMIKGMYVRCAIDVVHPDEPRDFILGRIVNINNFAETAEIEFFDVIGLRKYYDILKSIELPLERVQHCKISKGTIVLHQAMRWSVVEGYLSKSDGLYHYYLLSKTNKITEAVETEITASFNSAEISPLRQMLQYEFQNPAWYFGRNRVNQTMRTIESTLYGFKELAGCKISLKPYQLKTVMRCLSGDSCRYMIADEVGLGKTIESLAVLKVYLSDKYNKRVLIVVPDALVEQWKTELAFKFFMFEGSDKSLNQICILPTSKLDSQRAELTYDFIIVDEIHNLLNDLHTYNRIMSLSQKAKNVIMLSATPVQSREQEYHRLLSLIQPNKYSSMDDNEFLQLLDLQNKINRKIRSCVEYLSDYKAAIEESSNTHNEDTEEAYEELVDNLEDIASKTHDKLLSSIIDKFDSEADDFSIPRFERAVAYICEAYQLEKCVIRNRRKKEDTNTRIFKPLPYEMDNDFNNTEYRTYCLFAEWIESIDITEAEYQRNYLPIISALFSSAQAFLGQISNLSDVPDELITTAKQWVTEENATVKGIKAIMDDPIDSLSRMVTILDYIDQEAFDHKVLIFTHFKESFEIYKKALCTLYGEDNCCFFSKTMSADDLELNAYRFQTFQDCRILLSDESGGEGRNFQKADEVINIDLPWNANTIEQRVGRLDRIGRDKSKPVISVVAFAQDTIEKDLLAIWNEGLGLFSKSQSGLEIIMNEVDKEIREAVLKDFKYGLMAISDTIVSKISDVEKRVKEERLFDISSYQMQAINSQIQNLIEKYTVSETQLFGEAMMSWASMAGFRGSRVRDDVIRFTASSFSRNSAINTMLFPPDMAALSQDKINQMQNRIRGLSGDREIKKDPNIIQGTFDRKYALENDYIHFFAPGDEIFDSIVSNAIGAYKGRCCACAIPTKTVDWEGFIFNWYVTPNEIELLKKGISLKNINQYRGFISSQILSIPISIIDDTDVSPEEVLYLLSQIKNISTDEIRSYVAHLGKRSPAGDFLDIKRKYAVSNLTWFKEMNPTSSWNEKVRLCYEKSKQLLKEKKRLVNIRGLKDALVKEISSLEAENAYYGVNSDASRKKELCDSIFSAFAKPNYTLDSVCYIRMVKQ